MEGQQFSERAHAEIYNIYRPDIPHEISKSIMRYLREQFAGVLELALDVGCGSGQSTVILAPYFKRVVGFDESEVQIKEACGSRNRSNVTYAVHPAETLPFADNSVQLVTACASLHWFRKDSFFAEVKRVLTLGGAFVAYTYHFIKPITKDPASDKEIEILFKEKYEELHLYFSKEVFSSLKKYQDIYFPFEEVVRIPDVRQTFDGSLAYVIGYVETLSGFQNMKKKDPIKAKSYISHFAERLKGILLIDDEAEYEKIKLYRDFYIIFCRKSH